MKRPALHHRIVLIALLAGLPAVAAVLVLLWRSDAGPVLFWTVLAVTILPWIGGAALIRSYLLYRLRTLANMATALRQGDFGFRGRSGMRDGAFGSLVLELNALAETLREQRLDEMEAVALLRNVLGEIDVAVFAFDDRQRLRMINGAGERLLGTTAETAVGRDAGELGLGACLEDEPERTLALDLPGGSGRFELRRGGYRQLGRPRRLVVLSNVSRALRAEELAAWKRLIRVMSHELNNSLAPIRSLAGSLGRIVESDPPPEGWRDDLRTGLRVISSRADALNRFLGAYATLAKMPEPRREAVEVEPLVRRVAGLESRIPVTVDGGPEVTIRADRDQLEQLLINIVKNGADACAETGGTVRIGWEVGEDVLVLKIVDEGPGLSDTANLFVPFFSTRPEGTGIGLVLCRQIAEAHGGSVTLENREGAGGCEARVLLPMRR
jgi:nitrogen fixation/metabolism regulation signal transduction histidine kinase